MRNDAEVSSKLIHVDKKLVLIYIHVDKKLFLIYIHINLCILLINLVEEKEYLDNWSPWHLVPFYKFDWIGITRELKKQWYIFYSDKSNSNGSGSGHCKRLGCSSLLISIILLNRITLLNCIITYLLTHWLLYYQLWSNILMLEKLWLILFFNIYY